MTKVQLDRLAARYDGMFIPVPVITSLTGDELNYVFEKTHLNRPDVIKKLTKKLAQCQDASDRKRKDDHE